jgi:uncharacterized RDD family membrane protein YckC
LGEHKKSLESPPTATFGKTMEFLPRQGILLGERRTSVFNRLVARGIDSLIAVALLLLGKALWWPVGILLGCGYCAVSDGFGEGQSVGKRILGLRVEDFSSATGCDLGASCVRNLPFALALFLASAPLLWIFFLVLALPVLGLELYILMTVDSGVRLGDVLANTQVTERGQELVEHLS